MMGFFLLLMKASCWELHWVVSVQGLPVYKELTQDPPVLIHHETDSDKFIFLSHDLNLLLPLGVEEGIFLLSAAPRLSGCCQQFIM